MQRQTNHADWWREFHVAEMADLFLERTEGELNQTIEFLSETLQLRPGDRVYDQCCGVGTLSVALAKKSGVSVVGADLCEVYIDRARRDAASADAACEFHCDDAFTFVPDPCAGVFNWYSSFGYADSDSRNAQMFECAFRTLVSGGWLALDVPNFPGIIRGFQRYLVRSGECDGRHVTCVRESVLNLEHGRLEQTWSWLAAGEPVSRRYSALRLYWPHQIAEMLATAGFEDVRMFGGIDETPLGMDSPRLICIARKP